MTCGKVTVDLNLYNAHVTNTVSVMVDGKDLLPTQTFGSSFQKVLDLPAHTSQEVVQLIVKAGDSARYDVNQTKIAPVCQGVSAPPSTAPSTTPQASPTSTPAPSATASVSATAAAPGTPSPSPSSNLAETGGSSATPVIAGIGAAVVAAGAGLLLLGRRRRAGSH